MGSLLDALAAGSWWGRGQPSQKSAQAGQTRTPLYTQPWTRTLMLNSWPLCTQRKERSWTNTTRP